MITMQYSTAECGIYILLTTYLQKQHWRNHSFSFYGQSQENANLRKIYEIYSKIHFVKLRHIN